MAPHLIERSVILLGLVAFAAAACCKPSPNGLHCYTCLSQGQSCNPDDITKYECRGEETQCVDIRVKGDFGAISDTIVKGCRAYTCSSSLHFSTQKSSVSVQCCNGSLCNSDVGPIVQDMEPNGIECYSCNTVNGEGCSPEDISTTMCYGPLTYCMEISGVSKDDSMTEVVTKGCATPTMCESSFLSSLQDLDKAIIECCTESLCNSSFQ